VGRGFQGDQRVVAGPSAYPAAARVESRVQRFAAVSCNGSPPKREASTGAAAPDGTVSEATIHMALQWIELHP
jgi:hypothetical protein